MDLEFLNEFAVPIVVAVCLCIGYILKHLDIYTTGFTGRSLFRFVQYRGL